MPSKILLSAATFDAHIADVKAAAMPFFKVKESALHEAMARGYHARTYASLLAKFNEQDTTQEFVAFDGLAVVARLHELGESSSAGALGAFLEGVSIDVKIVKYPYERQRAATFLDVAYDVSVEIKGADPRILAQNPIFILPEFIRPSDDVILYAVDSGHPFRVESKNTITRGREGKNLLTAKLIDGRWLGGLFVFDAGHKMDDEHCIRAVKAALVRAILPVVSPYGHCAIYRPDHYDYGAWKVNLTVGPVIREAFGSGDFVFELPSLPNRHFLAEPDMTYFHRDNKKWARVVDGVWSADLYTNGISEEENPSSLAKVKAGLLIGINEVLRKVDFYA